ncbi:XRE family transcriptional regulator [Thioalkalivibrio sp. HK1]|uniref:XRE family transcriptional regulator n=1 Tax=Thioalkalivibrio sp. HK1 TaxID=1469245 RepID=UPI00046F30AD|nr:XRE family transcriptional regulator [Thioalkalivibrio sp. HK1]
MRSVNPKILVWARETAGLTREEAAKKLGVKSARGRSAIERMEDLECAKEKPTWAMISKMSKAYHLPLVVFYLSDIPPPGDCGEDFRALPKKPDRKAQGLIDAAVRDMHARQSILRTSLEDIDEAEPLPFIGSVKAFRSGHRKDIERVADSIRKTLAFDQKRFRSKANAKEGFAYLRERAEEAGIFVILIANLGSWHTALDVELFRGFVIADSVAPLVVINANDSPSAQSFTLVHELAHLWIGSHGISAGAMEGNEGIERFCNEVASEFLVSQPEIDELELTINTPFDEVKEKIDKFATERKISRTMVALRLYRSDSIKVQVYRKLAGEFKRMFLEGKKRERSGERKEGGPSYYVLTKQRLGSNLIDLVDRMMGEESLSVNKAAIVLGVKALKVRRLIRESQARSIS